MFRRLSLAILALACLLAAGSAGNAAGKKVYPELDVQINAVYRAKVVRVVDGDTAIIRFLMGKDAYKDERLRFIGVNTPESVDPNRPVERYGKEASNFTKKALTDRVIWVQTDAGVRDRHQRLLGYVWLKEPTKADLDSERAIREKMFNARLLLDGYAQVMTVQPNSRYAGLFSKFQREAKEAGKGLWGAK